MKKYLVLLTAFLFPFFSLAQEDFSNLQGTLTSVLEFMNDLVPLAIGIGVIVFLFGLISFITAGADEEKRKGARNTIIWGIIILFVMVSVWGLVGVLENTFGFESYEPENLPQIPTSNSN